MTCAWCQQAFTGRPGARFCSRRCAGLHQFRDHPRVVHKWGDRPDLGAEHRKLRAALLPEALGAPCPLCGHTMTSTAQLDHILPRARGGKTERGNCRIICRTCNQRRGAQLGGKHAHRGNGTRTQRQAQPQTVQTPCPAHPTVPAGQWHSRDW